MGKPTGFMEIEKIDREYKSISEKVALIIKQQMSLIYEDDNKIDFEEIVEEMVDILIRTLDLYASMRNGGFVEHSLDEILFKKIKT